ncbi:hypothetical protein CROQUDRAFT_673724 [Cronartium quercuum f. sp. fusiforme G11]|uniref:Secreted protein n=1 Tax=Cronartium quercuum f. sp. fusiforme G11 TaxID=708437 RepID=A0A9P6N8Y0_9BASI|nr:hypothetical protein CROQUDRAFT_673724 [Cronartium quercuum f. sp. fusiforme G11]
MLVKIALLFTILIHTTYIIKAEIGSYPICWGTKIQGYMNPINQELMGYATEKSDRMVWGTNCSCLPVLGGSADMYLHCHWGSVLENAEGVPPYVCGGMNLDDCSVM